MQFTRLYVVVEGQSEREFVKELLGPHLALRMLDVKPKVVVTNRKLNKRGGINNYGLLRSDLVRLLAEDRALDCRFTTMIDLYKLPPDFPGRAIAAKQKVRADKVTALEAAFRDDLGDPRFIPHLQVHEFETLLYCDLGQLAKRIDGSSPGIAALGQEVAGLDPEDINEGLTTAPSKRIVKHVPIYDNLKVRVGAPAASAIGLSTLRTNCPHFGAWVTTLEQLGTPLG